MKTELPAPAARDDKDVAAKQLEAFFLRRLLAETRPKGGMIDGGFAGETFSEMLNEAIADKMSSAGGIGMASMFSAELARGAQEVPQAHPMPHNHGPLELGPEIDGAPRMALPVIGRTSSGYGMRTHPVKGTANMHAGHDFAAPTGTPVSAAAAGTVTHAGPAGTYGNLVIVRHASGYETRYAHLSEVSTTKGAEIAVGDAIGKVGSTGMSTGPHLHFEVRHEGKSMDPAALLPLNSSAKRTSR